MDSPARHDEEPPLNPAAERLQRKLRRLMAIGGLTLGLGIFAVFAAIVYRISVGETRTGSVVSADATVPAGAKLVSTNVDGDRLVLGFTVGDETLVLLVDRRSLKVVGSLRLHPN